jgi:M6 family metalloprotease-like protein
MKANDDSRNAADRHPADRRLNHFMRKNANSLEKQIGRLGGRSVHWFLVVTASLHFVSPAASQVKAPDLSIGLHRGRLVIDWDERNTKGVLQVASDLNGPWSDVTGAKAPYSTSSSRAHRFHRIAPGSVAGPAGTVIESFAARAESNMGTWLVLPKSDWMFTRGQTWTHIRSGARPETPVYRSMSGHFLAPMDQTPVAVFFSAEAYVEPVDKRLFVRALIDGVPADPADVVFATGTSPVNPESRAFVFTGRVDQGLHTMELQWLVDHGGTGYVRDAAFLVRVGDSQNSDGSVQVFSPPSGPPDSTTTAAWMDVPELSGAIQTKAGESLAISVSAESYVTGAGAMFLRALVDGQPARPSDVLFAKGTKPQCRLMTFGLDAPTAGLHNVRIQWLAQDGGAFVGDRSLVLAATSRTSSSIDQVFVAPDSGPAVSTSSASFSPMPGLSTTGKLPQNGEVAVLFSAVTSGPAEESLHVRMTIDGIPVPDSEVQLMESDLHAGTHSFVFSAKHLYPEGPPATSTLRIEWRVANGKKVFLDDRTMTVLVKPPTVPDLAEQRPFGLGAVGLENFGVESQIGTRRLLVICWDPHRPGIAPVNLATIQQAVFGPTNSVRDYFDVVSGGKYTLNSALGGNSVIGWYDADGPPTDYFGNSPGCSGDGGNLEARRREMLQRAAEDIDFSAFDDNGDGVLDPNLECGILLVIPSDGPSTDKVRQMSDSDCGWFSVSGVIIPLIAEWLTDASGDEFRSAAHEIAHLMLGLDDVYVGNAINTRAGRLSLMENFYSDHVPHPDPLSKLALGWANPTIVERDGIFALEDIKLSHRIVVLPRKPGKVNDEYFILENRQDAPDNALYDKHLSDSGIAVWHIIESKSDNGLPPQCLTPGVWAETGNGQARRGLRVLRPGVVNSNSASLWGGADYDLLDTGLVCPDEAPTSADRRNALIWADGTPSGYSILDWSAAAQTMSFQIVAP